MEKRGNTQYRKCDARLLRKMSQAARGFDRARGKHRLEALRRYIEALNEFSKRILLELPQKQPHILTARRRAPER